MDEDDKIIYNMFLGKRVHLVLKNSFHYTGTLKSINDAIIVLNDQKVGLMTISIESIQSMEEAQ